MTALATVAELGNWLGLSIADDDERALLLLESASGLVRTAAGQTWAGEDDEVPTDARTVTLTSAARAWLNPGTASQTSTGPFQTAMPGVYLTDDERQVLQQFRTTSSSGVSGLWSLRTTRTDDDWPDLPDRHLNVTGSEPIPHVPKPEVNW